MTSDATDIAARFFVYKLYEATDGQPGEWQTLRGLGESVATISLAIERGWITVSGARGKLLDCRGALTVEGRRLARKGRWPIQKCQHGLRLIAWDGSLLDGMR